MTQKYLLNPKVEFKKSFQNNGEVLVCVEEGSERQEFSTDSEILVEILLGCVEAQDLASIRTKLLTRNVDVDALELSDFLVTMRVLVPENNSDEPLDSEKKWERWNWRDAHSFHYATRNMVWRHSYKSGLDKPPVMTYNLYDQLVKPDRPKPSQKQISPEWERFRLPPLSGALKDVMYGDVLERRKTTRHFEERTVSLQCLSDFVNLCCQPILIRGARPFRMTPTYSLGDFFSLYICINNVEGLRPGIYYYSYENNELCLIDSNISQSLINRFVEEQPFVNHASFCSIFTLNWDSYMWKYRFSRAYRLALFEISSLVQSALLIGTALGLQTFLTPAINERLISKHLEIDDLLSETPIYVVGLGYKEENITSHPDDPRNYPL